MAHRRLTLLSLLATFSLSAGLVRCSTDEFSGTDAGSDAPVATDSATDAPAPDTGSDAPRDVASDAISDADAAPPPKCDPKKPFGTPTKLSINALDVFVDGPGSFRIDPSETHAWLSRNGILRQYDVSSIGALTHVVSVPDLASSQGFGVSESGLELINAQPGSNLVRYKRGSLTADWGTGTSITVGLSAPDGSTNFAFYHPTHLVDGPTFHFGRLQQFPGFVTEWDIVRASPGDASTTFVATVQNEVHQTGYAFVHSPVVLGDDKVMYLARWGKLNQPAFPRLARTTRTTPQAAWDPPVDVTLGSLVVGADDTIKPYDVTPDDCALYFGYAPSIDGSFTLDGPFAVYVARRPL